MFLTRPSWALLIACSILLVIGIFSIYVTDTHYVAGHDGSANAAKQLTFLAGGAFVAFLIVRIGHQRIGQFAYWFFGCAVLLLVPPILAKVLHSNFGGWVSPRNGAYRWIQLPGFQLQPSEFFKVAFVIVLAWHLRYRVDTRRFLGLLLLFAVSALPFVLILLEPDLATVLLLIPVLLGVVFAAGAKWWHLTTIVVLGAAAFPTAWDHMEPYQRLRITGVLLQSADFRRAVIESPERYQFIATKRQAVEWEAGIGYQLVHSKNAIGSGGVWGNGWGEGIYVSQSTLPDRHNDFVFAIVAHQWGLVGCILVLLCYVTLVVCGMAIASATKEPFARLLAVALTAMMASQVVVNIGMATGLMPTTGITLPFVSYGGSSLLCNSAAIALLMSISQHRPYLLAVRPFEFGKTVEKVLFAERIAGSQTPRPPSAVSTTPSTGS